MLPETTLAVSLWYTSSLRGTWGPAAASLPAVGVPSGCDRVTWMRNRVIAAAEHHVGLGYQHHHIPDWDPGSAWPGDEGPGLDCSNFTAWVYDLGLGIKFTSNVVSQADGALAPGRVLDPAEALAPGDLLYIWNAARTAIDHVVMFVDAGHVIDSTSSDAAHPGVQLRPFAGWYQTRFSHARRVIE